MTNKLTKQYLKGALPCGFYYFKNSIGETYTVEYGNHGIKGCKDVEVLSEVPSFNEYEKLKKQLDIALETLGQIAKFSTDSVDAVQSGIAICDIKELDK